MMKQLDVCSNCDNEAVRVRGSYQFKESGLKNVVLQGIELIRCKKCGNEDPVIPRLNALMRVMVRGVISKPYRLTGHEVRFLRKFLRMTGEQFSHLIHIDKTTLSKWENDEQPIGPQSDLLIRALILVLGLKETQKDQAAIIQEDFPGIHNSVHDVGIEIDPSNMTYQYA